MRLATAAGGTSRRFRIPPPPFTKFTSYVSGLT
ncbi:hypothetical protein AB7M17_005121 [Bradyrhizobium sp. USDA 377]